MKTLRRDIATFLAGCALGSAVSLFHVFYHPRRLIDLHPPGEVIQDHQVTLDSDGDYWAVQTRSGKLALETNVGGVTKVYPISEIRISNNEK